MMDLAAADAVIPALEDHTGAGDVADLAAIDQHALAAVADDPTGTAAIEREPVEMNMRCV